MLTASCQPQSVVARSRFVEDGVQKAAGAAWSGERIEIDNAGVMAVAESPCRRRAAIASSRPHACSPSPTPTTSRAPTRRFVAATDSFVVATSAGVTTARCGHGKVGSVAAGESGCDALDVSVPLGAPDKLLTVVRSGDGKVGLALASAALAELDVHATNGAIDATTSATQGASLTLVSETGDLVTLRLPRDFAADAIVLLCARRRGRHVSVPGRSIGQGARGPRPRREVVMVRAGRIVLAVQQ